jgi:2-hydroxy-3-keto-5-methylthiopentenyl-1-phosphate phosphatase
LLPDYRAGITNAFEVMSAGYRPLKVPAREMIDFVRPLVEVRPGFGTLQKFCREKSFALNVVSQGLDFYIREFVPAGIPIHSLTADLNGHWQVRFPAGCTLDHRDDYKVYVLDKLKREHPGAPITFIGDGRNDFPIAEQVDHVFAVEGSSLAQMCREAKIECVEFHSFEEVVTALQSPH